MYKFLALVFCLCCVTSQVLAFDNDDSFYTDTRSNREMALAEDLKVLEKGEPFSYPLEEGSVIECYAKRVDGSIDGFLEYNDYFVVKNGDLYSNTMHKLYKPNKADKLKKVDRVEYLMTGVLKLYDPLWEGSIRHHMRTVKINTKSGKYYMEGTQDNWMWFRNVTATGYCRAISPQENF